MFPFWSANWNSEGSLRMGISNGVEVGVQETIVL
jgi:hypothetical protein